MGYTHDTQCLVYEGPDEPYAGRELCFGLNETAVSIADVTDKVNPVSVAIAAYPNVGYAHQGWLSADQRFFFVNDELDETAGAVNRTRTLVWDVSVLEDPILVKEHLGETTSSDHNLYVQDHLMYQSNYGSGLRILDVSDPVSPFEVGFFDSVPGDDDRPGLSGSWSNFPFFESGVIMFTSQSEGLFVVRRSP
jgi:choice-of-anchor B domain-containing protein